MDPIQQRQRLAMVLGAMVVVAVVAAVAMVVLSSQNTVANIDLDYSKIPQSRTEDGAFVLGNPDAPITIVEFADFLCPHCQDYHETMRRVVRDYVATGKAKLEYRMFLTIDHTGIASRLTECADTLQPGSFWTAHDVMYALAAGSRFDDNKTPRAFAERLGLDYARLLECAQKAKQPDIDSQFGRALGVLRTPNIMVRYGDSNPERVTIGGRTYDRGGVPYEDLKLVIESTQ